ncbi:MAG: periplasmic heavy metal sensor [Polyangiaceae bacterium]
MRVVARIVSRWFTRSVVIGGAIAGLVAVAAPVAAQAPHKPSPSAASIPPLRLPALPGLSAQQKQQLEQVHTKTQLMLTPLHAALWLRDQELAILWARGTDREQILAKLKEMDVIRGRVREILIDQRLSLLAVLTPEQRSAFLALLAKSPPRTVQKNPVLGLEECLSSGDCSGTSLPGGR